MSDDDDVVTAWQEGLFSALPWKTDPNPPAVHHQGASGGEFVIAAGFARRAFMKPARRLHEHTPWPAVEKICADLAIHFRLLVPPTQLFRRQPDSTWPEGRTCVSLILHQDFTDWAPNWTPGSDAERHEILDLLGPVSGIVAFDAYVGNVDRSDFRPNTVFYRTSEGAIQPAFIDFANCLNRQDRWRKGGWADVSVPTMPGLLSEAIRAEAIREVVERIEELSDEIIDHFVRRVPDDYQSGERASVVCQALKDRRALVRPALAQRFSV